MDHLSSEQRSALMKKVKQSGTEIEMLVRRGLHRRGLRFTLADRRLPGSPDLVLKKHRAVVFVHGCYWHGHACGRGRRAGTNVEYWREKIAANQARDSRNEADLRAQGWRVFVVWGCQLRNATGREALLDTLAGEINGSVSADLTQLGACLST